MTEDSSKNQQRLCSEIQLFDLCSKESCSHRSGRYCTHDETVARFEAIREEDDLSDMIMEDTDEFEDSDDPELDDGSDDDDYEYGENDEDY